MNDTEEQKNKKNLDGMLVCVAAFIGLVCLTAFLIWDIDTPCCEGI